MDLQVLKAVLAGTRIHDDTFRKPERGGPVTALMLRAATVTALIEAVEAAQALADVIERFRPLDGAFGSPNPFRLIEEAQDELRKKLGLFEGKQSKE
jgi:hypothetical protein